MEKNLKIFGSALWLSVSMIACESNELDQVGQIFNNTRLGQKEQSQKEFSIVTNNIAL